MCLHKTFVLLCNAKGAELCIVILESWQFTAVIFLLRPPCGSQTDLDQIQAHCIQVQIFINSSS